jgi:Icc-related predicted phosphoesterase
MIIIGLSDIHGDLSIIKKMESLLAKADVTLLVGDITNFGRESEIKQVLTSVIHSTQNIFAVSGNCDYPEVDAFLSEQNINLHGKGEVWNAIGFVGLGGSLVTPFQTPNELTEDEIEHYLANGYSQIPSNIPMILVSHQPPLKTKCDRISTGDHVGSNSVRNFIEKHQPLICFTGHIHESIGVDKIGDTYIINPGMLNKECYAYAEINEKVETIEIRGIP